MSITARIDNDIKSLRKYFQKKFELLQEAIEENKTATIVAEDVNALESEQVFFRIDHFIKPDMLINIYSLVDFWLKEICNQHKNRKNLSLGYNDIKGKNDLHVFQKYLIKVAGIDLTSVQNSYKHLDDLRVVRNKFIHNGGHVINENEKVKISSIVGISIFISEIDIEDSFIFNSLDKAKTYLFEAAKF